MIGLARTFGIEVMAEGVERIEQQQNLLNPGLTTIADASPQREAERNSAQQTHRHIRVRATRPPRPSA
ncbi:MAG: hypothetical protein M3414_00385 [Pseudomonadota bacterium]|nr:hypothetical protein [Pseudomonadota bacterium]